MRFKDACSYPRARNSSAATSSRRDRRSSSIGFAGRPMRAPHSGLPAILFVYQVVQERMLMSTEDSTALLLGATGYAGRHLARALHARGMRVRAVVRDRDRARAAGPWGSPPLADHVDEWIVAPDAEAADADGRLMSGVSHVVSALGVTRQKADPWLVDYRMNLRYLELAEAGGVASFTYVGVMNAAQGTSIIARAKSAFMATLARSEVSPRIVNPSGYFSDLTEVFQLARRGLAFGLGDGSVRLRPIHGEDLAAFCVDRLSGPAGSWDIGGPDDLSYREIVELAFSAVGRTPRYLAVPAPAASAATWVADRIGPRQAALTRFFLEGMRVDGVGQPTGRHRLADYFRELADR
ncbi:epimerase [Leucobacter sp. OAMLP11]|nr:epimerase [Leucobacter sp. OAMLP11]